MSRLRPGRAGSSPSLLTGVAGVLLFRATDDAGTELWRSDGTQAGTRRVADIRPGPRGSDPTGLTDVAGTLFFVASDQVHGRERWRYEP